MRLALELNRWQCNDFAKTLENKALSNLLYFIGKKNQPILVDLILIISFLTANYSNIDIQTKAKIKVKKKKIPGPKLCKIF